MPARTTLILLLTAAFVAGQDDPLAELAKKQLQGRIVREEVKSRVLRRKGRYLVYLPPGYARAADRRFPLVVLLHGLFANEERWLTRGGPQMIEEAIVAGRIPPVLVATPEGGQGFWVDGVAGGTSRRRTWLLEEFLPHVEAEYRVRPGRAGRFLVGHSTGATGALGIALSRPRLFAGVVAHHPMVPSPDPAALTERERALLGHVFLAEPVKRAFGSPLDPEAWRRNHPEALARVVGKDTGLRIRIESARDDRFGWAEGARRLHRALQEAAVPHEYHERPGDQGWSALREYLPGSLRFLLGKGKDVPGDSGDRPGKGR